VRAGRPRTPPTLRPAPLFSLANDGSIGCNPDPTLNPGIKAFYYEVTEGLAHAVPSRATYQQLTELL